MINKIISKEDINLNNIINYIFVRQNNFSTYFRSFPKEIKDIRKQVKKVSENIIVNYITEEGKIKLVSCEVMDNVSKIINILFLGFDDSKYYNEYKQYLKSEYDSYKITISSSKFNCLYNDLLNDDYFINVNTKKTIEIFETKLNKLKYRMNQDIIIMPLENYQLDEFKELHITKFRKTKKVKNLVVLYNNEMIGYFDYVPYEEYNEIIEYKIDERINNKEIVIGKTLLSIFDKHGKFVNVKISLIDDPNFEEFMKCGFLLIEEQKIFSN